MTGRPVWLKPWHTRFVSITYTIFAVDWSLTAFGYPSLGMLCRDTPTDPEFRGLSGMLADYIDEKLYGDEKSSMITTNTDQKDK